MPSPINVSYIKPNAMLAVSVLFPVLSIIIVGLRFYIRRVQKARLLADDWLLIPALLLVIGMGIALIIATEGKGIGYTKGIPPGAPPEAQFTYLSPEIVLTEKVQFAVQLMQIVSLGCIKLSFVMFYQRIFCTGKRTWFSISNTITGALIIGWTIAFFFVFLFYCGSHISKEWGTVVDVVTYCPHALDDQMALGISDSIMDVLIIALPIPMIMGLHLGTAKKLMVLGVFLLGGSAVAASMVRMGIFIKVATVGFNPNLDGDKNMSLILFWSVIEAGTGIVAACLPTMKFIFSRSMISRFFSSIRSRFSLHSGKSSYLEPKGSKLQSGESSSMERFANPDSFTAVESYAMKNTEYPPARIVREGAIMMDKTLHQQESFV